MYVQKFSVRDKTFRKKGPLGNSSLEDFLLRKLNHQTTRQ